MISVGDTVLRVDSSGNKDGAQFTVVSMLESTVFVLRYEAMAGEPNWSGAEGYTVADLEIMGAGKFMLVDIAGDRYIPES